MSLAVLIKQILPGFHIVLKVNGYIVLSENQTELTVYDSDGRIRKKRGGRAYVSMCYALKVRTAIRRQPE